MSYEGSSQFIIACCGCCGDEYEVDLDAAPEFCAMFCSQGCARSGGWFR
jgi:hypothetical protein